MSEKKRESESERLEPGECTQDYSKSILVNIIEINNKYTQLRNKPDVCTAHQTKLKVS